MTINEFAKEITKLEGKKKEVNIAQVLEILRIIKALLLPLGVNIYKLIRLK